MLRRIAEAQDGHSCKAVDLSPPLSPPLRASKRTGLDALGSLKEILWKIPALSSVVLIVDRDAFKKEEPVRELERKLREYGYEVEGSIEELAPGRAYRAPVRVGRSLELYVAVSGEIKELEEDIDKLLSLMPGEKKFTRALKNADSRLLKEAFPGAWRALEEVERRICAQDFRAEGRPPDPRSIHAGSARAR
ncbi:MAG: hypothetical protein C0167_01515 [Nitrososphaera sp.]|nr:MAG: hypothetical protein C0167_01515 [Nitrososphaera sp.]